MADVKKAVKAILERVNTAEKAVALKGKEREKYLKAIEEEFGPVEQRQKLTGHTEDTFHGTTYDKPIDKFKTDKSQSGQVFGKGTYSTKNPEEAEIYSQILDQESGIPLDEQSGSVYPLKVKLGKVFNPDKVDEKTLQSIKKDLKLPQKTDSRAIGTIANPKDYAESLKKHGFDSVQVDDVTVSLNSNQIRSKFAAFDPRFKDSDLIMAANKGKKSAVETGLNALSIPQKILMRKTAKLIGAEVAPETDDSAEDADKASEAIVERGAQMLGIPESSQAGAIAKGVAKTALDVGYDPLSMIPVGRVAKAARGSKLVEKVLSKLGRGEKALERLPSMVKREEAVLTGKMRDIKAQEAVDIAKRKREEARWAKLSLEEKQKLWEKQLQPPEAQKLQQEGRKAFEETEAAKEGMGEKTRKWLHDYSTKLTREEELAQASLDADKERAARMLAPQKELEKTEVLELKKKK